NELLIAVWFRDHRYLRRDVQKNLHCHVRMELQPLARAFLPREVSPCRHAGFLFETFRYGRNQCDILPPAQLKSFDTWRETVPGHFVFAVKASRFITHMKKLKSPRR